MQVVAAPGDAAPALSPEQVVRLARARTRSLFIATPVARNPVRQYTIALLDTMLLLGRLGIAVRLHWVVGNSNLARARNELVAEFLATDCTDLLFVDDDMGWRAGDVLRLLASPQGFIGGVGRKKTPDSPDTAAQTWCCRLPQNGEVVQDDLGAIAVEGIGTGFVKISRAVFEAVAAARPELKRPGLREMSEAVQAQFHRFFHFADDGLQPSMSEDFDFCRTWAHLGGTVWADPTIRLVHVGEREFTGTIEQLLEPAGEEA